MSNGKIDNLGNGNVFGFGELKISDDTMSELGNCFIQGSTKDNKYFSIAPEQIIANKDSIEIVPCGTYVLVKPYEENPYEQVEVLDGGLTLPKREIYYKNPNSGEVEKEENLSVVGHVLEVGPNTKFIKPGDDIYYRRVQGVPVPFFRQGLEVVSETSVQAIVNEGLSKRFKTEEHIEVSLDVLNDERLGETMEERIKNLKRLKQEGIYLK